MIQIYEIGGSVRDRLLKIESKDKDFVVVFEDISININDAWDYLLKYLKDNKYEVFLETKDCFTVRAKFPKNHINAGLVADFVMARRDVNYNQYKRKPEVILGSIEDDVFRRDFCCNSLFIDTRGKIIDLTGRGLHDIYNKIISTPLNPMETFMDDPLRIFRAIRFAVVKGFDLAPEVASAIMEGEFNFKVVSTERVREELYKCFKHDTLKTLEYLEQFPKLKKYAFYNNKLWLMPTNKLK